MKNITLLGVTVTSGSLDEVLSLLFERIKNPKNKTFITTPNPEMIVYANEHPKYLKKINTATIALPDGIGMFFASGYAKKKLKERITGVDFIEKVCMTTQENPLKLGFLGGRAGVAEATVECLKKKYPWLKVVFVGEEWNADKMKKGTTIDMLFVAFGIPKQEEWIFANLKRLPIKAAMGVGGSFDFISGIVPRAPFLVRWAGLEWLFRLIVQPWRVKRQLKLFTFLKMVVNE
jgi:N-acetylglucosaminyldiphosphoundecaprenol N-acetyl-beta-D-mannosaminyltransferase